MQSNIFCILLAHLNFIPTVLYVSNCSLYPPVSLSPVKATPYLGPPKCCHIGFNSYLIRQSRDIVVITVNNHDCHIIIVLVVLNFSTSSKSHNSITSSKLNTLITHVTSTISKCVFYWNRYSLCLFISTLLLVLTDWLKSCLNLICLIPSK